MEYCYDRERFSHTPLCNNLVANERLIERERIRSSEDSWAPDLVSGLKNRGQGLEPYEQEEGMD